MHLADNLDDDFFIIAYMCTTWNVKMYTWKYKEYYSEVWCDFQGIRAQQDEQLRVNDVQV